MGVLGQKLWISGSKNPIFWAFCDYLEISFCPDQKYKSELISEVLRCFWMRSSPGSQERSCPVGLFGFFFRIRAYIFLCLRVHAKKSKKLTYHNIIFVECLLSNWCLGIVWENYQCKKGCGWPKQGLQVVPCKKSTTKLK